VTLIVRPRVIDVISLLQFSIMLH